MKNWADFPFKIALFLITYAIFSEIIAIVPKKEDHFFKKEGVFLQKEGIFFRIVGVY